MALLCEGDSVRDTYLVERFLGEGAFAEVYRVQHRFLGRQALKLLKTPCSNLSEIEDLLGEAMILSRLGHPNIVRVFDANVVELATGPRGFFTMEYVAGGSLDRYWRSYNQRLMPVSEAVGVAKQVCAGLAVAHGEDPPIIHRDIKPQNILVGYDAAGLRVRVSDFGLAKRVNPLTLLASAQGTLAFKPPEFHLDQDSSTGDVWALGTTIYLLLTDTLPYPDRGDDPYPSPARFKNPLRPASLYNAHVDAKLQAILARCLALKPGDRFRDASDLLAHLARYHPPQEAPHSVAQPSPPGPDSKSALGHPSPGRQATPRAKVAEALKLARQPGTLMQAADLLEEALNQDAALRECYEPQLRLWRRGVCM